MITDHTIISARAEQRQKSTEQRHFIPRWIAAALAAAALSMPALAAWGMDSPQQRQPSRPAAAQINFPPIPYIDSMPWMKWEANINAFKTDILLAPPPGPAGIALTPEEYDRYKLPTS
jgi:hypothetical protein